MKEIKILNSSKFLFKKKKLFNKHGKIFYFRSTSSFKKSLNEQFHIFGGGTELKFSKVSQELKIWQFFKVSIE